MIDALFYYRKRIVLMENKGCTSGGSHWRTPSGDLGVGTLIFLDEESEARDPECVRRRGGRDASSLHLPCSRPMERVWRHFHFCNSLVWKLDVAYSQAQGDVEPRAPLPFDCAWPSLLTHSFFPGTRRHRAREKGERQIQGGLSRHLL